MEVAYRTKKLAKTAATLKDLIKSFGAVGGKKFAQRLSEFAAAQCLEDLRHLPGPRIHELKGNRKGQFSADLKHPYRLIFTPNDDPPATKEDGGWDWQRITIIEILEVADTHE
jgi:proteic killer suppression protein